MYLKKMEIQGFKSFADALKLDFNKGITAVVGPNGSGKSNIADSIRWVLGEQSAKSLRGAKMEDIIFAGTQNRKALGFAEVSITLDNSDGKIPISFGEVTITRRVYRSGESEYSINRTACRLKDIHELFMDTGVGKEGYSIIGQGQIDRILSTKPDDRRILFEEAVGIVKYKSRKIEAEKKLEKEKQNLTRIEDIISELEKQIGPLSVQAEKTKQYLSIKEDLKQVDLNLFIEEADHLKEEMSTLEEAYSVNEDQLSHQKKLQTEQKSQYENLRKELDDIENQIFQIQSDISDIKTSTEKISGSNKVISTQIEHLLLDIKRLQNECIKIDNKIIQLNEEKNRLSIKKNGLSLELKSKEEVLEENEKKFNKLNEFLSTSEMEIENFKSDIIEKMNESSDVKSNVQKMSGIIENIESRKTQIKIEKARVESQYKDRQTHLQALNKVYSDNDYKKKSLEKEATELAKINNDLLNATKEKSNKVNSITERIHPVKSRKQILEQMEKEHEGFNKSVKNILQLKEREPNLWKGIYGVVAQLIKVPAGYETAIEIALGSTMQNIVTDTEETSKKVIEHLKKNKSGRATFLPLSAIKERDFGNEKDKLLQEKGVLGIASSIIEYNPTFHNIMSNLLGRVLVVENLDYGIVIAKKYNHRIKIVTLDGDLLNAGGSMTGGSIYQKSNSFFTRTRELTQLNNELNELINDLENAQKDLDNYKRSKSDNETKIEEIKNEIQEININILSKSHEIQQSEEVLIQLEDKKNQLLLEEEQLSIQYEDVFSKLDQKTNLLHHIEKEIEEIHSKVESHQSHLQTEKSSKEGLAEGITKLRIEISSLKQDNNHVYENIKRIENEIMTLGSDKHRNEQEIDNYSEQKESKEKEIEKNKDDIDDLNVALEEKQTIQSSLQESKKTMSYKLKNYEEDMDRTTKNIEHIQQEIFRLENKQTKLKLEQENLYNRIWEEYEETYHSALKFRKQLGSVSEMKNLVGRYKSQIKSLGNINLDAVEECEKVKERYEFLSEQQKDILDAEAKLYNIINELTASMEKQFKENFASISANFNEVFSELFGGGKGYLHLIDEDNVLESGIEIIAQPPGKKLQNMMLLSGGERALTAIALLFSILRMKPSPFCILDEIEAALDDANVNRFAEYLKKFDNSTQFIVITHRKGTMEVADTLYGVTMQEQGISKLLSVKLSDIEEKEEAS